MKKFVILLLVAILAITPLALVACKDNQPSQPSGGNTEPGGNDPADPDEPFDYHLFDRYPDYYTSKGNVNLDGEYFDRDEYLDTYLPMIRAEEYRDYASLDFDYSYHTALSDQGLFWAYVDEAGNPGMTACRDHEAVDDLIANGIIDPGKPTIVFIHGIQMGSYNRNVYLTEAAITSTDVLSPNDPLYAEYVEDEFGTVQTNTLYYKNGYNVLCFAYNRFADEGAIEKNPDGTDRDIIYAANRTIESKVWTLDGVGGIRYRLPNGLYSDGTDISGQLVDGAQSFTDPEYAIDITVAEYFCGEWIRCLNYLDTKGIDLTANNIRFAGHSMGCEVTTSSTYLLTELVRVGQIERNYLPDRVCMLDGYMGFYPGEKFDPNSGSALAGMVQMTCTFDCHVNWTGALIERGGISSMMTAAVREIVNNDIAYEYYIDGTPTSMVSTIGADMRTLLFSMVAVVKYMGSYGGGTHNSIRSIYCASQVCDEPDLVDADGNVIGKCISSKSSDQFVKDNYGKVFVMVGGIRTGSAADDVFAIESETEEGQYQRDPDVVVPLLDEDEIDE